MTLEEALDETGKINQRLLFILGATLPIVMKYNSQTPQEERHRNWILESIEAVVYRNEELPRMPE